MATSCTACARRSRVLATWKQLLQIRTFLPSACTYRPNAEQAPHTSKPHRLQWCRLRITVNSIEHSRQRELARSRTQSDRGTITSSARPPAVSSRGRRLPAAAPKPTEFICRKATPPPACRHQESSSTHLGDTRPRRSLMLPPPPPRSPPSDFMSPSLSELVVDSVSVLRSLPAPTEAPPRAAPCGGVALASSGSSGTSDGMRRSRSNTEPPRAIDRCDSAAACVLWLRTCRPLGASSPRDCSRALVDALRLCRRPTPRPPCAPLCARRR